jgi:hypothetical protein
MRTPLLLLLALTLTACDDGPASSAPPDAAPVAEDQGTPDAQPDAGPQPELSLEPAALSLLAAADDTATGSIVLRNLGEGPLTLNAIAFEPPTDRFTLADAEPGTLAPGAERTLQITYTAAAGDPHRATLRIQSDDADEGDLKLPITGRVAARCVRAMPGSLDLGQIQPGDQSGRFRVTITNCGDIDASVRDITMEGDPGFFWETTDGGDPIGQPFPAGGLISLNLWFENANVAADALLTGSLLIQTDDPRPLRITLQVRTTGLQGCHLVLDPDRIEYGSVRVGTSQRGAITLRNQGLDACTLRNVSIAPEGGPFGFIPLEVETLGAGEEATLTVSYAPRALSAVGDRGTLQIDYRDEGLGQNRRETAFLNGVGAEALVAGDPFEGLDFGKITQPDGCAAPVQTLRAINAGFVPLCLTGYHLEGDDCDQFTLLTAPEIVDDCLPLEAMAGAAFEFQFVPAAVGDAACDLVVDSDADNAPSLPLPLVGEGVQSAETTNSFTVGRLNAANPARFVLSRVAVADGMAVLVDDAPSETWRFEAGRNSVTFDVGAHPARDASLRVVFQAACAAVATP